MNGRSGAWLAGVLVAAAIGTGITLACGDREGAADGAAGSTAATAGGAASNDASTAPFVGKWVVKADQATSSCGEPPSFKGNEIEVVHAGPKRITVTSSDCPVGLSVEGQLAQATTPVSCDRTGSAASGTLRYDVAKMQLTGAEASLVWKFTISGEGGGQKYECKYDATLTLERP